jgi:hypothetical protein
MNPSLILCGIISPLSFALSAWTGGNAYFVVGCVPLAITALQLFWFTVFDRDRLQNDRHVENKMLITRNQIVVNTPDGKAPITLSASPVLTSNVAATDKEIASDYE